MKSESDPNSVSGNSAGSDENMVSEYKKMLGKESKTDSNISLQENDLKKGFKDSKINDDSKEIQQAIEDAKKDFPEIELAVGSAAKAAKGDSKKHLSILKKALNALKDQKEESTEKFKKKGVWKQIAILGLLVGGLIGINIFIRESQPNPSSSEANQPGNNPLELVLVTPPTANAGGNTSGNNPLELVLITPGSGGGQSGNPLELVLITPAAPVCSMAFTKPEKTSEIPTYGPALFEWTNVPIANEYFLKVSPPPEAGPPWTFQVSGNSKNIYMENFPMGGKFTVSIIAFSNDGKILCGTTLYFDKDELAAEVRNQGESSQPPSTPCIDTGIGYFCR
jgi:hypothetical protein